MNALEHPPLDGPWHLAPNPYSAQLIPGGGGRKYERALSCCLPGCAGHGGRDIDTDSSDRTLRAVWGGQVHRYGFSAFGNNFGIHNAGAEAFYAHAERFLVPDGATVSPGQAVAVLGSSGQTTGPHCHFELRTHAGDWCTAIDPTAALLETLEDDMTDAQYNGLIAAINGVNKQVESLKGDATHPFSFAGLYNTLKQILAK